VEARAPRPDAMALGNLLHRHEADIVPGADIARSRISKSDQEQHQDSPAGKASLLLGAPPRPEQRQELHPRCARRGTRSSARSAFGRHTGSGGGSSGGRCGSGSFGLRLISSA